MAVALPGGRGAVALSAGALVTCALLDDGSVACWGIDDDGQLGDGAVLADQPAPVPVPLAPGRTAAAIAAGGTQACATLDDGSVVCWGGDADGALGNGDALTVAQPAAAQAPSALSPSTMTARVVDLSLTLTGAPARLAPGATARLTLRVASAGPDQASGVRVLLSPSLLALVPATPSQGRVAGPYWEVGTVAPGGAATLALDVTGLAAGQGALVAEVAAADQVDPTRRRRTGPSRTTWRRRRSRSRPRRRPSRRRLRGSGPIA
ncbi:MAG: hypothetical protein R3C15_15110 [Thermoleophilia bacterium]